MKPPKPLETACLRSQDLSTTRVYTQAITYTDRGIVCGPNGLRTRDNILTHSALMQQRTPSTLAHASGCSKAVSRRTHDRRRRRPRHRRVRPHRMSRRARRLCGRERQRSTRNSLLLRRTSCRLVQQRGASGGVLPHDMSCRGRRCGTREQRSSSGSLRLRRMRCRGRRRSPRYLRPAHRRRLVV